jgi:hypothetical protein
MARPKRLASGAPWPAVVKNEHHVRCAACRYRIHMYCIGLRIIHPYKISGRQTDPRVILAEEYDYLFKGKKHNFAAV